MLGCDSCCFEGEQFGVGKLGVGEHGEFACRDGGVDGVRPFVLASDLDGLAIEQQPDAAAIETRFVGRDWIDDIAEAAVFVDDNLRANVPAARQRDGWGGARECDAGQRACLSVVAEALEEAASHHGDGSLAELLHSLIDDDLDSAFAGRRGTRFDCSQPQITWRGARGVCVCSNIPGLGSWSCCARAKQAACTAGRKKHP